MAPPGVAPSPNFKIEAVTKLDKLVAHIKCFSKSPDILKDPNFSFSASLRSASVKYTKSWWGKAAEKRLSFFRFSLLGLVQKRPVLRQSGLNFQTLDFFFLGLATLGLGKRQKISVGEGRGKKAQFLPFFTIGTFFPKLPKI